MPQARSNTERDAARFTQLLPARLTATTPAESEAAEQIRCMCGIAAYAMPAGAMCQVLSLWIPLVTVDAGGSRTVDERASGLATLLATQN